jgi:hypothetical protein
LVKKASDQIGGFLFPATFGNDFNVANDVLIELNQVLGWNAIFLMEARANGLDLTCR